MAVVTGLMKRRGSHERVSGCLLLTACTRQAIEMPPGLGDRRTVVMGSDPPPRDRIGDWAYESIRDAIHNGDLRS